MQLPVSLIDLVTFPGPKVVGVLAELTIRVILSFGRMSFKSIRMILSKNHKTSFIVKTPITVETCLMSFAGYLRMFVPIATAHFLRMSRTRHASHHKDKQTWHRASV